MAEKLVARPCSQHQRNRSSYMGEPAALPARSEEVMYGTLRSLKCGFGFVRSKTLDDGRKAPGEDKLVSWTSPNWTRTAFSLPQKGLWGQLLPVHMQCRDCRRSQLPDCL